MGSKQTVKLKDFLKVIQSWGLEYKGTKGGHERWSCKGMTRPVIIQTHKKEIPEFILKNNLKTIGKTINQFFESLDSL